MPIESLDGVGRQGDTRYGTRLGRGGVAKGGTAMSARSCHRRFATGVAIALLTGTVVALAGVSVPPSAKASASTGVQTRLNWSRCFAQRHCGHRDAVPMRHGAGSTDYDSPSGAAVQLAVVRIPARDQAHKIGSIFLNPGGPGGSGVDFALFFGPAAEFFWGSEVRDRFDLVGFDPPGVGRSTALRCFGNLRQSTQAFAPFAFPMTPEEEAIVAAGDALLAQQCAQRGNKIGDHMSTANVARDLDRLRAAAGDAQLSYVGFSYGTVPRDHLRQHVPRPCPRRRRRRCARSHRVGQRRGRDPVLDTAALGCRGTDGTREVLRARAMPTRRARSGRTRRTGSPT